MSSEQHWPWSELGLPPETRGPRDVKRAYARRLKKIDMAADPEGFQQLRQAYEMARSIAEAEERAPPQPEVAEQPAPAPPRLTSEEAPAEPPAKPEPPAPEPEQPDPSAPPRPASAEAQAEPPAAQEPPTPKPEPEPEPEQPAPAAQRPASADPAPMPPPPAAEATPLAPEPGIEELIEEMTAALAKRNFDKTLWRSYLNRLTLLSFDDAAWFETRLVEELERSLAPNLMPDLAIPPDWCEIIEARFGWRSDGLRFQRRFPRARSLWNFWSKRRIKALDHKLEAWQKTSRKKPPPGIWKGWLLPWATHWGSWIILYLLIRNSLM